MPDAVAIWLEHDSPKARYALDTLFSLLGESWRAASPDQEAALAYGPDRSLPAGPQSDWDDPRPLLVRADGLPVIHLPGGPAQRRTDKGLGFDVLFATYACLTAPWEQIDPANEVGTPIAAEGWLSRNGILEEPLVHRYAEELRALLGAGRDSRGKERRPVVVLTHDVDEHFGDLFAVRAAAKRFSRDLVALRPGAARRAAGLARALVTQGRTDPNDRWNEWHELVCNWGGRSTFFVASYSLFDDGADRYDVPYDVRRPTVAATFRRLADAGAEIGVHLSLQARRAPQQVAAERERLEAAVGVPVRAARHHWWALGRKTWRTLRAHAAAGLRVDCSFGFNDLPGFRRGIAAPFHPFDVEEQRALPVWSLPTVAMDRAVFDGSATADAALGRLRGLFEATRESGGALVLDWHTHVLNPHVFAGAGQGLRDFVAWTLEQGAELRTPLGLVDDYDHAP
jgi:hypothetical protein